MLRECEIALGCMGENNAVSTWMVWRPVLNSARLSGGWAQARSLISNGVCLQVCVTYIWVINKRRSVQLFCIFLKFYELTRRSRLRASRCHCAMALSFALIVRWFLIIFFFFFVLCYLCSYVVNVTLWLMMWLCAENTKEVLASIASSKWLL